MISASDMSSAFPDIPPGVHPLGTRVLIQLRAVRKKTTSGLVLVEETREFNKVSSQLGKVVALGPIAYCKRDTGEPWPEGTWVQKGDLVRVPKYGGDRFERKLSEDETVIFCIFQDHEVISKVDVEVFSEIDEIL